jgi:hypothetical protein
MDRQAQFNRDMMQSKYTDWLDSHSAGLSQVLVLGFVFGAVWASADEYAKPPEQEDYFIVIYGEPKRSPLRVCLPSKTLLWLCGTSMTVSEFVLKS